MFKYFKEQIKQYRAYLKDYELLLQAANYIQKENFDDFKTLIKSNPSLLLKELQYHSKAHKKLYSKKTLLELTLEESRLQKFSLAILSELDKVLPIHEEKRKEFFNLNYNHKNIGAMLLAINDEILFNELMKMGARLNHFDTLSEFCQNPNTSDLKGYIDIVLNHSVDEQKNVKRYTLKVDNTLRKNVALYEQLKEKTDLENALSLHSQLINSDSQSQIKSSQKVKI